MLAEEEMKYCPRCGQPLTKRHVGGRDRRACANCDFIYFRDPKVAVAVFVTQDDTVLLVRRIMEPERGKWALPAGFVDFDEDPREAAVREVKEETGLVVELETLIDVLSGEHDHNQNGANIVILYAAQVSGGELMAQDDVDRAEFFAPDSLPELAFSSTTMLIERWLAGRQGG